MIAIISGLCVFAAGFLLGLVFNEDVEEKEEEEKKCCCNGGEAGDVQ